jgi:Fe2+ or Zn2+ uptake regulation protein
MLLPIFSIDNCRWRSNSNLPYIFCKGQSKYTENKSYHKRSHCQAGLGIANHLHLYYILIMDNSINKLILSGYKLTKTRLAVLKVLSQSRQPFSAKDMHKKIGQYDQASVYRVLGLLESLGLVKSEFFKHEKLYCSSDNPHHHIVCRQCGYIENFPCSHKFNRYKNFTDIEHQLTLYGICGKCKAKL